MGELALCATLQIGDVQIIEMLKIVGQINHFSGTRVYVKGMHAAWSGSDWGKRVRDKISAKDLCFALGCRRKVCCRRGGPVQFGGNQIEITHRQLGWCAAG